MSLKSRLKSLERKSVGFRMGTTLQLDKNGMVVGYEADEDIVAARQYSVWGDGRTSRMTIERLEDEEFEDFEKRAGATAEAGLKATVWLHPAVYEHMCLA